MYRMFFFTLSGNSPPTHSGKAMNVATTQSTRAVVPNLGVT